MIARWLLLGSAPRCRHRRTAVVLPLTQSWAIASRCFGSLALGILILLFFPADLILVIGDTPQSGLSLAVSCTASEGATPDFPPGILLMGEEKDAAMPAPGQVLSQIELAS